MIQLYFGPPPNARKISMMLEEIALDYQVHEIDILAGDQFKPQFLAINPNNRRRPSSIPMVRTASRSPFGRRARSSSTSQRSTGDLSRPTRARGSNA